MFDTFSQPRQNPGEAEPFTGTGKRVWIDLQTGQQVKYQAFWLFADGSERVDYTQQIIIVEKVETAPKEILNTLVKAVRP